MCYTILMKKYVDIQATFIQGSTFINGIKWDDGRIFHVSSSTYINDILVSNDLCRCYEVQIGNHKRNIYQDETDRWFVIV